MADERTFHMSSEEFRKNGHALIDWIADYQGRVESFPVLSRAKPGELRAALPPSPPEHGESFETMMADVDRLIVPGITHWQSPNFFAFFPSNTSGPSILGELLSAGFGVQGMLWATSPACTELETHVLDWVAQMLELPEQFRSHSGSGGGAIQESASSAALCALIAARERATADHVNVRGGTGKLVAYASTQTHSSIEKAVRIAGIGSENLRLIDVDERWAIKPAALEQQIRLDREAGLTPFFACATIGTTSSNAIDPVRTIGQLCKREGIWLHVDSAMSGTAGLCPEFRYINDGIELADSYAFNPHKWMFTNFDCDCFYVSNKQALINALSILPEYLRNQATESGAVIDYRDWQVSLGRRFRALKLWFVIRHYGIQGLRYHVREHVALAQSFADWVRADERFELVVEPPLNLVCFRYRGSDAVNQKILEALNASGELYLTHTKLAGRFTLRLCVGQTMTELRHVQDAWKKIREAAGRFTQDREATGHVAH